jgi:CubicO group peptidase (beta-lactamase class C family)
VHDASEGRLNAIAEAIVRRGAAPTVACGFGVRRADGWFFAHSDDGDALFDLASITKPFTALACASLPGFLETALERALPWTATTPVGPHPLRRLLGHRAGLDAHVPLFLPALEGRAVVRDEALQIAANALRSGARPAPEPSDAVYSDLGYVLAGEALARAHGVADAGEALEAFFLPKLELLDAIGTARGLRARHRDAAGRFVPTESMPWRGGVSRGAVHDDNAWVLTGESASGHAGLFGTLRGVLRFGSAVVDGWLHTSGPLAALPFASLLAREDASTWRTGFDGKSLSGASTAGASASPQSIGHLGFTGTSLWIDPDRQAVTVLLTNRVHPSRDFNALRELRGPVHDALFELADRA